MADDKFDPDAFLAQQGAASGDFDPDAFLADKDKASAWGGDTLGDAALDVAKSGGIGFARGAIGGIGSAGSARELAKGLGVDPSYIAGALGPVIGPLIKYAPSGQDIQHGIEKVTGEFYKPKTDLGQYVESGAEFAGNPLSYIGPGGLATKAGVAVAGGLGKQFAENAWEDESTKPYAGIIGALAGSLGASGLLGLGRAITNVFRPYRVTPEFGIPTTKGAETGNIPQIAEEQAMESGARGSLAQGIMQRSADARRNAIEQATGKIGEDIGGEPATPTELGESITSGLGEKARAYEALGNEAFESAKQKNAWAVAGEHRPTLAIDAALANDGMDLHGGLSASNRAYKLIKGLEKGIPVDEMGTAVTEGAPSINAAPSIQSSMSPHLLSLREMLNVRHQLRPMRGVNPEDQLALQNIKSTYDTWTKNAIENALFYGDKTAIADVQRGNKYWYEFKQLTDPRPGSGERVQKILSQITNEDKSGAEVANYLMNSSTVGSSAFAAKLANRIRGALGSDSDEWEALRQAAWNKLLTDARTGGRQTPIGTARAIKQFVDGNGHELARTLYTPAELNHFRRLAGTIEKVSPAKVNPPGSGHEVARWGNSLVNTLAGVMGLEGIASGHLRWTLLGSIPIMRNVKNAMKADIATKQVPEQAGFLGRAGRATIPAISGANFEGQP